MVRGASTGLGGSKGGVGKSMMTLAEGDRCVSLVRSAQGTADTLGNSVIPTIDLLRVGLVM
ncbi:MAG TPA: hypothetical protein VN894_17665 [Polyangiaceae bacterium]|nr:hypothetical protein [Polyangiaceae bacterium]